VAIMKPQSRGPHILRRWQLRCAVCLLWIALTVTPALPRTDVRADGILGLPKATATSDPLRQKKVRLGEKLFFDARLSADGSVSCATCHSPEKEFTDRRRTAVGIAELRGTRNTPSLLNVVYATSLFWDGRADSLESQALEPFFNPREHGLASPRELLQRIEADREYVTAFRDAFGSRETPVTGANVAAALAAYQRTLVDGNSAFDRFQFGGEQTVLSAAARRGYNVFVGLGQCAACHTVSRDHALFTDNQFHAIGFRAMGDEMRGAIERIRRTAPEHVRNLVSADRGVAALGRFVVTRKIEDLGKFRTPSLRNVALTAPYMHDGGIETLEEAVEHELYYRGHTNGSPIVLTPQERDDLVTFLQSLTGARADMQRRVQAGLANTQRRER